MPALHPARGGLHVRLGAGRSRQCAVQRREHRKHIFFINFLLTANEIKEILRCCLVVRTFYILRHYEKLVGKLFVLAAFERGIKIACFSDSVTVSGFRYSLMLKVCYGP